MKTHQVKELLNKRFTSNEWALLFEVRNTTGYSKVERYADAIAMNMWPSRGLDVIGFEIKVSRGDWLHELKQPEKSAPIIKYCDEFYLVVGDKDIVKEGELPSNWGLIVPYRNGLKVHKKAPRLTPTKLDRTFIASMLRQAQKQYSKKSEFYKEVDIRVEESLKQIIDSEGNNIKELERKYDILRNNVTRFRKETGINLHSSQTYHDIKKFVDIIKFLRADIFMHNLFNNLRVLHNRSASITGHIQKLLQHKERFIMPKRFPRPIVRISKRS